MRPALRAVEVEQPDVARHVGQRVDEQLAGHHGGRLDRVLRLRNDRLPVGRVRPIDGSGDDLLVRRVAIGQQIHRAVHDAERVVGRGVIRIQRADRRVELRRHRVAEVLDEQLVLVARALVRRDRTGTGRSRRARRR